MDKTIRNLENIKLSERNRAIGSRQSYRMTVKQHKRYKNFCNWDIVSVEKERRKSRDLKMARCEGMFDSSLSKENTGVDQLTKSLDMLTRLVNKKLPDAHVSEEVSDSVNIGVKAISDAVPLLHDLVNKFPNLNSEKNVQDVVKEITSGVVEGVVNNDALQLLKNLSLGSAFIASVIYALTSRKMSSLMYVGATAMGLALFGNIPTQKETMFSMLTSIFTELSKVSFSDENDDLKMESMPRAEMLLDDVYMALDALVLFASTYVSLLVGWNIPVSLFRGVSEASRIKGGVREIAMSVCSIIEKVINWVRVDMLKMTPYKFFSSNNVEVDEFYQNVQRVYREARDGELFKNRDSLLLITKLIQDGKKLALEMPSNKDTIVLHRHLQDDINLLKKLQSEFEIMKVNVRGSRQEPIGVLLRGPPCSSKSIVLEYLAHALMAAYLSKHEFELFLKNPELYCWNRSQSDEFMSGLTHQHKICYFDEFAQKVDVAGARGDAEEIFSMVNSFEYLTNQANLENKGCVTAQFAAVLATTNRYEFKCNSIVSEEALMRRFGLQFLVIPRPEFTTPETASLGYRSRKIDMSRLPTIDIDGKKTTVLSTDVQFFLRTDTKGEPIDDVMFTFDEMADMCVNEMFKKQGHFRANRTQFSNITSRFRQKYKPREYAVAKCEMNRDAYGDTGELYKWKNIQYSDYATYVFAKLKDLKSQEVKYFVDETRVTSEVFDHINESYTDSTPSLLDTNQSSCGESQCTDSSASTDTISIYKDSDLDSYFDAKEIPEHLVDAINSFRTPVKEMECNADQFNSFLRERYVPQTVDKFIEIYKYFVKIYPDLKDREIKVKNLLAQMSRCNRFLNNYQDLYSDYIILFLIWNKFPDRFLDWILREEPFFKTYEDGMRYKLVIPPLKIKESRFVEIYRDFREKYVKECEPESFKQFQIYWPFVKMGLATLFMATGIWAVGSTFLHMFGFTKKLPKEESYNQGDKMHNNKAKTVVKTTKALKAMLQAPKSEGISAFDISGKEKALSINRSNVFQIRLENIEGELCKHVGYCMFIRGRTALMPRHYVVNWTTQYTRDNNFGDWKLCLISGGQIRGKAKMMDVLLNHESEALIDSDAVLVRFVKPIQPAKDHISSFLKESDFKWGITAMPFLLPVGLGSGMTLHSGKCDLNLSGMIIDSVESGSYKVARVIEYMKITQEGDCGSPLFLLNNKLQGRKVAGIHIAGHDVLGRAYSSIITQEMLLHDLDLLGPDPLDDLAIKQDLPLAEFAPDYLERFNVLGKLDKWKHDVEETDIVKTRFYGCTIEAKTSPVHLKKFYNNEGLLIDPHELAISKYCKEPKYIDPKEIEFVVKDLYNFYQLNKDIGVKHRTLDLEEALFGSDVETDWRSICASTSPGFGTNLIKDKWKKKIFAEGNPRDKTNRYFKAYSDHIDNLIKGYLEGKKPMWLWADSRKDERKPIEKVITGKMRLFCCSPFDLLVLNRMYFGTMSVEFKKNRIHNGTSIGVNPYSIEWDTIVKRMSKFVRPGVIPRVTSGDYKGFDGSHIPVILYAVLTIAHLIYSDALKIEDMNDAAKMREFLWDDLVFSYHVTGNTVYQWHGALPSGHFLTLLVNCICAQMYLRLSFYRVYPYLKYDDNVVDQVLGDDGMVAVSDVCKPKFNEITMSELMLNWGQTYTTELKCTATSAFRKITEVEYLKRGFKFNSEIGRWLGPLRLETALEICYWAHSGSPLESNTIQNVETTCYELVLHGEEVYNKFTKMIEKFHLEKCPDIKMRKPICEIYGRQLAETCDMDYMY